MDHSPGSWRLEDERFTGRVAVMSGTAKIVTFGPRGNWDKIDHGNALLIKSAPAMYAALQAQALADNYLGTSGFSVAQFTEWEGLKREAILLREAVLNEMEGTP